MEGAKAMNFTTRHLPMFTAAFAEISSGSATAHPGHWDLALRDTHVEARIVDSWLVMTSPVTAPVLAAQLLGWNAILPGWVKFASDGNDGPQIRAEIPIDEEPAGGAYVRDAWSGFEAAQTILTGSDLESGRPASLNATSQADLKRLCEEAGWNATLRGENAVAIELESRGAFHQATFAACDHGLRAAVDLAAGGEPEAESAEAIGLFLLAAAGEVRMARPAMETAAGKAAARFEFIFSTAPDAVQLAHAFSALSVACQVCAAEVKALRNPDVARDFLALRSRAEAGARSISQDSN